MNALIIAQHHGAFLTLESCKGKFERITVVVPKSQIDKYAGFPEKEFQNYYKNLQLFCKGWAEVLVVNAPTENPMVSYINMLREIGGKGKWAVLAAGSIFQGFDETKLNGCWYGVVVGRLFDQDQRLSMYGMLGLPPSSSNIQLHNYFLNLDNLPADVYNDRALIVDAQTKSKQRTFSSMSVARSDVLIGQAISSIECLRVRYKSFRSAVLYYWMNAIKKTHPEQAYLAYGLDEYAQYAKKVKKYLPPTSYGVIAENGKQSARYREIAELDL